MLADIGAMYDVQYYVFVNENLFVNYLCLNKLFLFKICLKFNLYFCFQGGVVSKSERGK